ncbi:hypothetical protein T01_5788 [Trichinella spiralis]|uniref:Uncharacterized protein n=1 Tax=Trichinella spiralis TaxID=6334 RepID=A0A0V1A438_TRISP|nr:hypothetical protein T01_5788 [Trichinella spiralis]
MHFPYTFSQSCTYFPIKGPNSVIHPPFLPSHS